MRHGGVWDDPLGGRDLGHRLRHVLVVVLASTLVFGVVENLAQPLYYPAWFAVAANVALAVPIVVALVAWRSPTRTLASLRVEVVVAMVVRLLLVVVLREPMGVVDYPPLGYPLVVAMGATGVVLLPPLGLPVVLVSMAVLSLQRVAVVGAVQAVGEAVLTGSGALVAFVAVRAVRTELDRVAAEAALTERRRHEAALSRERTRARERWDALIHDTVLASLTLATREQDADAAVLAAEALAQLAGRRRPGREPLGAVTEHGERLGIELRIRGPAAWPSGAPGEALEVATCEALTNVARHSGGRAADLTSRWDGECFEVAVVDRGRGFVPEDVPQRRLGLRSAVRGTMAAVGGTAQVRSEPGAGTRVVLRVPPSDPAAVAPEPRPWRVSSLAAIFVLVGLDIASAIGIGVLYLDDQILPVVSVAGMVLIPLVTLAVAVIPVRRPWWPLAVAAVALVWGTLLGNVAHPEVLDYRIWFIGAFNPAVVVVALRHRLRTALGIIVVASALGSVMFLSRGEVPVQALAEGTYQTVIWAALGGSFRRFMDRMSRQVGAEVAARALADQGRLLARARDEEISRRQESLDEEVVPMLRRIASGQPLAQEERRRCSLLQSTTRDHLVAESLLAPDLLADIRRARERRVVVVIAGRRVDGTPLDGFWEAARALLAVARPHDRVQLNWRRSPHGDIASACLTGPGVGAAWSGAAGLAGRGRGHRVSVDDDSVLIEVRAAP